MMRLLFAGNDEEDEKMSRNAFLEEGSSLFPAANRPDPLIATRLLIKLDRF